MKDLGHPLSMVWRLRALSAQSAIDAETLYSSDSHPIGSGDTEPDLNGIRSKYRCQQRSKIFQKMIKAMFWILAHLLKQIYIMNISTLISVSIIRTYVAKTKWTRIICRCLLWERWVSRMLAFYFISRFECIEPPRKLKHSLTKGLLCMQQ